MYFIECTTLSSNPIKINIVNIIGYENSGEILVVYLDKPFGSSNTVHLQDDFDSFNNRLNELVYRYLHE